MRRLRKFFTLTYPEKKLLARSLLVILVIRIGLWILPFNLLDRWSTGTTPIREKTNDWTAIKRVARSVKSCSRFIPYATCLTQALATRLLLRMDGQPCDLKIGVEKDRDEKFGAHAWIEVDGQIVIGKLPKHHRFAVLSSN